MFIMNKKNLLCVDLEQKAMWGKKRFLLNKVTFYILKKVKCKKKGSLSRYLRRLFFHNRKVTWVFQNILKLSKCRFLYLQRLKFNFFILINVFLIFLVLVLTGKNAILRRRVVITDFYQKHSLAVNWLYVTSACLSLLHHSNPVASNSLWRHYWWKIT